MGAIVMSGLRKALQVDEILKAIIIAVLTSILGGLIAWIGYTVVDNSKNGVNLSGQMASITQSIRRIEDATEESRKETRSEMKEIRAETIRRIEIQAHGIDTLQEFFRQHLERHDKP